MDIMDMKTPAADGRDGEFAFTAELRPHRSASVDAVHRLIVLLLVIFVPTAIGFTVAGAWPVTGFMGFELVLLYACFRINLLRGAAVEHIDLRRRALTVERVNHWGQRQAWTFEPQWTRVELKEISGHRGRLSLSSRGRAVAIGGFLTFEEQGDLARALKEALARATAADFSAVYPKS